MYKKKSLFITFEGIEGSGKSYQSKKLFEKVKKLNIPVILTREPGGSNSAEIIRKIILTGSKNKFLDLTDTFLYFAARNEHFHKTLKPSLQKKKIIICDRFIDSTVAYQVFGKNIDNKFVNLAHEEILKKLKPDLTFVLILDINKAFKRMKSRKKNNRYDKFSKRFYSKVQEGYIKIAKKNKNRCIILNSTEDSPKTETKIYNKFLKFFDIVIKKKEDNKVLHPINQLTLFGYEKYFNSLIKLLDNKKLPNVLLFSGPPGSGKSTFVYHFINYLFSTNEENKYILEKYFINDSNKSYKNILSNIHPNFYLLNTFEKEKEIKVDQSRNLIKFLNKSTFSKELKIVMIENVEMLNQNASNALLKVIEEPSINTFFFITYNNSYFLLDTIKSRCTKFKIFFTENEKKNILDSLINQYSLADVRSQLYEHLFFDTPGNIIKYFLSVNEEKSDYPDSNLDKIFLLIDKYKIKKTPEILNFLCTSIEKFYYDLIVSHNQNSSAIFYNYNLMLTKINNMKKLNLDEKATFLWIKKILINETK